MSLKKFFQCAKGIFIQNQHYLNKFLLCSFSLDKKMNQKDQGCTQFVKTITPFLKRKKLVPKTRDFKQLFFFNGKRILFLYTNCFRPKQTAFKEVALRHYEGEGLRKNSSLNPATKCFTWLIRVNAG
jgi:hypothetical protein